MLAESENKKYIDIKYVTDKLPIRLHIYVTTEPSIASWIGKTTARRWGWGNEMGVWEPFPGQEEKTDSYYLNILFLSSENKGS